MVGTMENLQKGGMIQVHYRRQFKHMTPEGMIVMLHRRAQSHGTRQRAREMMRTMTPSVQVFHKMGVTR